MPDETIQNPELGEALSDLKKYGEGEDIDGLESAAKHAATVELPSELSDENAPSISPGALNALSKEGNDSVDVRSMLRDLKLPQKVKLALFGNKACRAALIMDGNKLIQLCVLKNAKLVEQEVVDFSRNANMPQLILRAISEKREWMKCYEIKYNIVTNPKTPSDIALKWLRFLQYNDIKEISRSKNLPQVVAVTAKKKVTEVEEQKKK